MKRSRKNGLSVLVRVLFWKAHQLFLSVIIRWPPRGLGRNLKTNTETKHTFLPFSNTLWIYLRGLLQYRFILFDSQPPFLDYSPAKEGPGCFDVIFYMLFNLGSTLFLIMDMCWMCLSLSCSHSKKTQDPPTGSKTLGKISPRSKNKSIAKGCSKQNLTKCM